MPKQDTRDPRFKFQVTKRKTLEDLGLTLVYLRNEFYEITARYDGVQLFDEPSKLSVSCEPAGPDYPELVVATGSVLYRPVDFVLIEPHRTGKLVDDLRVAENSAYALAEALRRESPAITFRT